MKRIRNFIKPTKKKIIITLIVSLLMVTSMNFIVIKSTENQIFDDIDLIPNKKTALVLGTIKGSDIKLNRYFQYRMEAAAELYFKGKVKQIIVSGDNHSVNYDETTDMAEYLIKLGVPDSVIIRDYAGFRTLDSVIRAKKVFNCSELIIVSQKFHNQRALFIANQYNIDAVAYNARDVQRKFNLPPLREFLSKTWVVFDLFVFNTQPKFLGSPL